MAEYNYISQEAESLITEGWTWGTDIIMSDDGTEQRISYLQTPFRKWSGNFTFTDMVSLRRHMALMYRKFGSLFYYPLFHQLVVLKAKVAAGTDTIQCNVLRSDFRVGNRALIYEGETRELVVIESVTDTSITMTTNFVNSYSQRARVCPVVEVYSANNAAVVRRPIDDIATATFSFFEYRPQAPFLNPENEVSLELFATYPVLNKRAIGSTYESAVDSGAEVIEYGGVAQLRSRWLAPQKQFVQRYQCNRLLDYTDWNYWLTFADYCKGSQNPFFLPTWREDAEIFTPAVAAGTQIHLVGHEYFDHYYSTLTYRNIVIWNDDGQQHFATVTNVASISGNDRLTFTPALPAGDWSNQKFSFLLKCRIADDTVSIEHDAMQSFVTLNLRTVD